MAQNRNYTNYRALAEKLKRMKIKHYGMHATFLLDTFVIGDSKIFKDAVIARKLIPANKMYSEWRDELVRLNILEYDYNFSSENKDKCRFYPGHEIVHLINEEILIKKSIVTRDHLKSYVESKNYVSRDEMNKKILEAIKITITELIPPISEDKVTKILFAIARKNIENGD